MGAKHRGARLWGFARGAVAGMAVAYLFDPQQGRSRRARLRDRGASTARRVVRDAQRRAMRARDEAKGSLHELAHPPHAPEDDRTLRDTVQSQVMGRAPFNALSLNVDVVAGVVTLRGVVPQRALADELGARIREVPGVRGVQDLLHLPGEPAPNKEAALHHA